MKKLVLFIILLMSIVAVAEQAENIIDRCTVNVNKGKPDSITDTSISTAWKPDGDGIVRIKLPNGGAQLIQISWLKAASDYTITEYSSDGSVNGVHSAEDDGFSALQSNIPLSPDTGKLEVSFGQKGQGIRKIRIFGAGTLPETVTQWNAPYEKCDLLVISTHMDDEWLWFGGIIPYYDLVAGKKVQVAYMVDCGGLRHFEALNGLAASGVSTYPIFIDNLDENIKSYEKTLADWGGDAVVVKQVAELIRMCKPEVILTHDINGEYGHNQHKVTSSVMEKAIEAASDPTMYSDSYEEYGAWQVKKLYRHLEKSSQIRFDWHIAYDEFSGLTAFEVAKNAMDCHASQLKSWHITDGGQYDNALFGLSWSCVGDDMLHNDLFENLVSEVPNENEPIEIETDFISSDTEVADIESSDTYVSDNIDKVDAEPESIPEENVKSGSAAIWILVPAGLAMLGFGGYRYVLYRKELARKRRRAERRRRAAERRLNKQK